MTPIRFSLFCILILATAQRLSAQASFTAKVSPKVAGDQDVVEIDFTLDGVSEVDQFAPPDFGPFQVVQGPSYTSGFQLINGNASRYYSVSFYLKPSGVGKFTIGPATVQLSGQTVHSNSVTLEIVKGSVGGNTPPPSPFQGMMPSPNMNPFPGREAYGDQFLRKGEKAEDKIRRNMILKMTASRNTVYVGEPVVATCKLYSRLESDSKVAERPSFSGFSVFEMVQPEQGNISREVLGGRPFNTYLIRKAQLYPLQSGDLTIEPIEIDNNITFFREGKPAKPQQAPAGSVFDQMMRDFWGDEEGGSGIPEKHALNLTTTPITIHVKPLPESGKPADFSGAVGQFTLQANLTSTTLKANQTDTLELILTGSGNLPLISAPTLHLPNGLEAFDPSAKEQVDQSVAPIKGRKVFSYAFTANRDGKYALQGLRFSYFDPQTATYKTDSTAPLLLDVLPGPAARRTPQELPGQSQGERRTPGWIWAAAAAVVALIVLLGLSRRKKNRPAVKQPAPKTAGTVTATSADNAPVRRPAETAAAKEPMPFIAPAAITTFETRDWMEGARHQLREGNSAAYYRELNAGLWGLLRERLDIGHERNKHLVLQRLGQKGFSPHVVEEVRRLLEECELSLYAPIHTGTDMQRSLEVAERLQKRFEHGLKD